MPQQIGIISWVPLATPATHIEATIDTIPRQKISTKPISTPQPLAATRVRMLRVITDPGLCSVAPSGMATELSCLETLFSSAICWFTAILAAELAVNSE